MALQLEIIDKATERVKRNNIAFGKPTKQSTTASSWTSERAVDGNSITWSAPGFYECTHSNTSTSELNWWAVDLGRHYKVTHVVIYGRDDVKSYWLENYDIDVIEHSKLFGDKWATFQKGRTSRCHYQHLSSKFVNATCPPDVKGRFVRIKKRSNAFDLCLCEVEVYGDRITNMTEESNPQKTKAYGFPGKVYNGILLQKMLARSNFECTNQCISQIGCCAGIYNKVTKECSLMRKSDNNEETTHSFHADEDCSSFLI
ncbi:Hypothetical predicted protein [Mytilus galloprovincialis]|uniref:F5/8 type C domain-containing protein n=1 Tax=Mytilus galloprovincialis TaxID=29158 RepID=A0A8B6GBE5_MYTGA|nr:Hypothetical predicted protein [Mytilus galloprovincialis]